MSIQVICNFCGELDDWGNPPFFPDGGKMDLYDSGGGNTPAITVDICPTCIQSLTKKYPLFFKVCEEADLHRELNNEQ